MIQQICAWLLYKCLGWTTNVTVDIHAAKYIICLAPHTSNWDLIIGQLYSRAEGVKINYLMKREWFFFPLSIIFKRTGGIPVHRQKHSSMTDALADTATKSETFRLCITPEGTRKRTKEWKRGFYFIAHKAHIPVYLYGVDYERKLIQCTEEFIPPGDVENEIKRVKEYFSGYKGKHPELFDYE